MPPLGPVFSPRVEDSLTPTSDPTESMGSAHTTSPSPARLELRGTGAASSSVSTGTIVALVLGSLLGVIALGVGWYLYVLSKQRHGRLRRFIWGRRRRRSKGKRSRRTSGGSGKSGMSGMSGSSGGGGGGEPGPEGEADAGGGESAVEGEGGDKPAEEAPA